MSDLNKLTIAEARDALRKGETTSVALTESCLAAIDVIFNVGFVVVEIAIVAAQALVVARASKVRSILIQSHSFLR